MRVVITVVLTLGLVTILFFVLMNSSFTVPIRVLPGIDPENIDVSIDHGVLTIKGRTEGEAEDQREDGNYMVRERRSGSFIRSLRLPETVDADQAKPNYDNGVLTITLPKAESKKAKHLTVTVGKALEGGEK